jgi:hypothetical protein
MIELDRRFVAQEMNKLGNLALKYLQLAGVEVAE